MSAALHGKLQDFGIAEVFQLIGQQRKTGILDVTQSKQTLRLAFDEGCVVWARPVKGDDDAELGERLVRSGLITQERLAELRTESGVSARPIAQLAIEAGDLTAQDAAQIEEMVTNETIFVILRWTDGSFDFSAQAVRHNRPPEKLLAAEQILMDGLRMVDEWQTFAGLVPNGDTIFERANPITFYKKGLSGEAKRRLPSVERVYALVDGRLTAQRIIDLSRLGLFDATRALAELHNHQVIVPLSKRQARARRRESDRPRRPVVDQVRWWVAAAFPLAVLTGVVSMVLERAPSAAGEAVFPIVRTPLEDARSVFEKRRVRHAVEAQYLLSGSWPADLTGRDRTGLLGGDALTPEGAAPYYYARRGDGIVLLAPPERSPMASPSRSTGRTPSPSPSPSPGPGPGRR